MGALWNLIKFIFLGGLLVLSLGAIWVWQGWENKIIFGIIAFILIVAIRELLRNPEW